MVDEILSHGTFGDLNDCFSSESSSKRKRGTRDSCEGKNIRQLS